MLNLLLCRATALQCFQLLNGAKEKNPSISWQLPCTAWLMQLGLPLHIPTLTVSKWWLPIIPNSAVSLLQSIVLMRLKWQLRRYLCQESELRKFWWKLELRNCASLQLQHTESNQVLRTLLSHPKNRPFSLKSTDVLIHFMDYTDSKDILEHVNPPLNLRISTEFDCRQKATVHHMF